MLADTLHDTCGVPLLKCMEGSPTNFQDQKGTTCLHAACRSGSSSIVEVLVLLEEESGLLKLSRWKLYAKPTCSSTQEQSPQVPALSSVMTQLAPSRGSLTSRFFIQLLCKEDLATDTGGIGGLQATDED